MCQCMCVHVICTHTVFIGCLWEMVFHFPNITKSFRWDLSCKTITMDELLWMKVIINKKLGFLFCEPAPPCHVAFSLGSFIMDSYSVSSTSAVILLFERLPHLHCHYLSLSNHYLILVSPSLPAYTLAPSPTPF